MAGMRNCRKLLQPFRANIEGRCLKCRTYCHEQTVKIDLIFETSGWS